MTLLRPTGCVRRCNHVSSTEVWSRTPRDRSGLGMRACARRSRQVRPVTCFLKPWQEAKLSKAMHAAARHSEFQSYITTVYAGSTPIHREARCIQVNRQAIRRLLVDVGTGDRIEGLLEYG